MLGYLQVGEHHLQMEEMFDKGQWLLKINQWFSSGNLVGVKKVGLGMDSLPGVGTTSGVVGV